MNSILMNRSLKLYSLTDSARDGTASTVGLVPVISASTGGLVPVISASTVGLVPVI